MRPNVDIPWSVHGRIKEYAQTQEITIEEAYVDVLREGLSVLPLPAQTEDRFLETSMARHSVGTRVFPVTSEEARDINDICTFLPRPTFPTNPVSFKTPTQRITIEDVEKGLARLSAELDQVYDDWFTFHQLGGAWVGTEMSNFVHCLKTLDRRLEEADFATYKTGFGIYILEFEDGEYLFLQLQLDTHSYEIESFRIGFLTDGHPVDGRFYRKLISQFGISDFQHAKERNLETFSVTPEERTEVEVVDKIVEAGREDEEWVSGLIIENPLQHHEVLKEQVLSQADDDTRRSSHLSNPYEHLTSYDHAYVRLKTHHPLSEDRSYILNQIRAHDLTPVLGRQDIWNLSISVDWN